MNQCKERGTITRDQISEIITRLPATLGYVHDTKRETFMVRVQQLEEGHEDYDNWKAPTRLCASHVRVADHPMCIGHISLVGACIRLGQTCTHSVSCMCIQSTRTATRQV